MTAGERLFSTWSSATSHLAAMSLPQLVTNLVLTALIIAAALALIWGVRSLASSTAHWLPGPKSAERTVRTSRVTHTVAWVARLIFGLFAVVLIANVWGVDLLDMASKGLGAAIVGTILHLALLFVITVIAFELAGFMIGRLFSRVAEEAAEARRRAQLNTLGPLLETVAQSVILIVAALMALGEMGVQIGPLLAGAGVVGIALGFGAQTLVKDFLTGVFLIVEDIVSVGDIVRIGESGGLVERMTLRTIRLRDFDGTLHIFPYGEAQIVHNLTKTFSYYVFNLQISYGSNIDDALRIMKRVGAEMLADEAFATMILEPIEVVGVDNLADSGVVLKARIKTKPMQQWAVGREYNHRIKLAFDRAGVEIPFPHMKVVLPDQQLSELAGHAA
jgi:small conductance mechanosensitive channel